MKEDLTGHARQEALTEMLWSMFIFGLFMVSFAHDFLLLLLLLIFAHFLAVFVVLALVNMPFFVGRLLDSMQNRGRIEACEEKTS